MRWENVTAVFGGTFDPPHLGHIEAVRGLFRLPGVQRVLVMPAAQPPHKPSHASSEQRLEMAEIAFSAEGRNKMGGPIEVSRFELEQAKLTGRPNYSFETLQALAPRYPDLAFVIGADQLESLPSWYRFPEVLDLAHWIVLERKPAGGDRARAVLKEWEGGGLVRLERAGHHLPTWRLKTGRNYLVLAPTEAPELSSTRIREHFERTGEAPENAVLPEILNYLEKNHLYGITDQNMRKGTSK